MLWVIHPFVGFGVHLVHLTQVVKTDARSRLRKLSLESLETGDGVVLLSIIYTPPEN